MAIRDRAAAKKARSKTSGKSAAKTIAATRKLAPVKKPAAKAVPAAKKHAPPPKPTTVPPAARPAASAPAAKAPLAAPPKPVAAPPKPVASAKPAGQTDAAARLASAQQAEERRKAATRKLFARLRSLEAIVGADLRKRGSLLLSQAVDQWYAEAISATASDVTITNAARAVIAQL